MKIRLVLLVFAILIAFLCLYILYSGKRILIEFSNEGDIISDGGGSYVNGNQGVKIEIDTHEQPAINEEHVFLRIYDSPRCVSVGFLDVAWKDRYLRDKPPRLSLKRYNIDLKIIIDMSIENSTLARMGIGERLEPTIIDITFYDRETDEIQGRAVRASLRLTPTPDLPEELYEGGHAYIIKESEDSWILDVNAWFEMAIGPTWPPTSSLTYYIKLDFRMTLEIKDLL